MSLDEYFYSIKDALAKSNHIYRDCAVLHRNNGLPLRLLYVGSGTGLNATVTAVMLHLLHLLGYRLLRQEAVRYNRNFLCLFCSIDAVYCSKFCLLMFYVP